MHSDPEERSRACAYWLWDYLRRCGASGLFLPLSGGLDSSLGLALVGVMCHMVLESFAAGEGYNKDVIRADVERLCGKMPVSPKEMVSLLMHTGYLATSNSSEESQNRAGQIAA